MYKASLSICLSAFVSLSTALSIQNYVNNECPNYIYLQPQVVVGTVLINQYFGSNTVININGGVTINVNNAPTQLSTVVTTTATTTAFVTNTVLPLPVPIAPMTFVLVISEVPNTKRQISMQSFLGPNGETTVSCSSATMLTISDGQLFNGTDILSTDPGVTSMPFAFSPAARQISRTFALVDDSLVWSSDSFVGGKALLCLRGTTLTAYFTGALPADCRPVALKSMGSCPSVVSSSSWTTSTTAISTSAAGVPTTSGAGESTTSGSLTTTAVDGATTTAGIPNTSGAASTGSASSSETLLDPFTSVPSVSTTPIVSGSTTAGTAAPTSETATTAAGSVTTSTGLAATSVPTTTELTTTTTEFTTTTTTTTSELSATTTAATCSLLPGPFLIEGVNPGASIGHDFVFGASPPAVAGSIMRARGVSDIASFTPFGLQVGTGFVFGYDSSVILRVDSNFPYRVTLDVTGGAAAANTSPLHCTVSASCAMTCVASVNLGVSGPAIAVGGFTAFDAYTPDNPTDVNGRGITMNSGPGTYTLQLIPVPPEE